MTYEYAGYLKNFLYKPDPTVRDALASVVFSAEELAQWRTWDLDSAKEWQHIPAHRTRSENGVTLEGRFRDVRRIDNLAEDDPRFWVALSTIGVRNSGFPIDVGMYPIVEITYRCLTERAYPAWMWTYRGGEHLAMLPHSTHWRTVARMIPHGGFPEKITNFVFRLYTTQRSTEAVEVEAIRFREMSPAEIEACAKNAVRMETFKEVQHFPILDEFLPRGVFMDAEAAERLADLMGVGFEEYWRLALEDVATHGHNCIALDNLEALRHEDWRALLQLAEKHGVRFVGRLNFPMNAPPLQQHGTIQNYIAPYTDSKAVLAWSLTSNPCESNFNDLVQAKAQVEKAEPNHPVASIRLSPDAYALFGPYFAASGVGYAGSRAPWRVGELIQAHLPLCQGQQYWHIGQSFVYGTNTPEWSSGSEMRLMVNLAFSSGAKGWFSYMYHNEPIWNDGAYQRSLTGPFLNFSDLWMELDQCMTRLNAYAPLLLGAKPDEPLKKWFITRCVAHANAQVGEGAPPVSLHRLRGADYSLYSAISNDIREMATVHINIPATALRGLEIYDVSDFLQTRTWEPMERKRHLEMFPGQAHTMLVAEPEVCDRWRDVIAERIIEADQLKLDLSMELARAYNLDVKPITDAVSKCGRQSPLLRMQVMHKARDMMLNLLYDSPAIGDSRSRLVEAAAAICGCDGTLCRLVGRGRRDQAHEMGEEVIPLAREIVQYRLELRAGRGKEVAKHCETLSKRALRLLERIRAAV